MTNNSPTITWHPTAESAHRAFWEQSASDAGMTYEEMMSECTAGGLDEDGKEVELSTKEVMRAIERQGVWGFHDSSSNEIHAWAAHDADTALIIHMLAHELGHATGEQHQDEFLEEMRAEQFGRVAALAYKMAAARPTGEPQ